MLHSNLSVMKGVTSRPCCLESATASLGSSMGAGESVVQPAARSFWGHDEANPPAGLAGAGAALAGAAGAGADWSADLAAAGAAPPEICTPLPSEKPSKLQHRVCCWHRAQAGWRACGQANPDLLCWKERFRQSFEIQLA